MNKEKLLHLPLEAYKQRYTQFLADWEREAFGVKYDVETVVPSGPGSVLMDIRSGRVLDEVARPVWAMQQVVELLQKPNPLGRIYCSDFYTPGLSAIAYSRRRAQLNAFCWAQTFDRYDFTVSFMDWMRPWEVMAFNVYANVFVASTGLADLITTALPGILPKVHVVGLPFNSAHVSKQLDLTKFPSEELDCVYSSRWDTEKDPNFFLSLVERCPDVRFGILTGHAEVTGNDAVALERLKQIRNRGVSNLTVYEGLDKGGYYSLLTKSAVQFNCALQDWVSYTLLEALTFGCAPLYPNRRSFPETLHYVEANLYRPGDLDDAEAKLRHLISTRECPQRDLVLKFHDSTLSRIADIML